MKSWRSSAIVLLAHYAEDRVMAQAHPSSGESEGFLRQDKPEEGHGAYYVLLGYERHRFERCARNGIEDVDGHGVNVEGGELECEVNALPHALPHPYYTS